MPIAIVFGAAAAAAAVSYLVPLIISCIVGGVAIIVTFFTTRAYYKNEHEKDSEMQELQKQQMERDNAIREEVSKIALETGIDIQTLLKLSKEQQEELKYIIQEFMKNIDESDIAAQNLNLIANTIQEATNNATIQNTGLHLELEKIKNELISVYGKLKLTETNLSQKEAELKKTLETINNLGEQILNSELLDKLTRLENAGRESQLFIQNDEIISLRAKNAALAATIESLNKTIEKLQQKLANCSENEKQQIKEIQHLIFDNKLLTETIESLTESIESQNQQPARASQNTTNHLRIFK